MTHPSLKLTYFPCTIVSIQCRRLEACADEVSATEWYFPGYNAIDCDNDDTVGHLSAVRTYRKLPWILSRAYAIMDCLFPFKLKYRIHTDFLGSWQRIADL
jgi:hypothetical protein